MLIRTSKALFLLLLLAELGAILTHMGRDRVDHLVYPNVDTNDGKRVLHVLRVHTTYERARELDLRLRQLYGHGCRHDSSTGKGFLGISADRLYVHSGWSRLKLGTDLIEELGINLHEYRRAADMPAHHRTVDLNALLEGLEISAPQFIEQD